MATFKERINQLYEEAKDANYQITQEEYASQFDATRNQLKGWLDGRGEPSTEMLKTIAKVHNVNVSWLVGETDIRKIAEATPCQRLNDNIANLPPEAIERIEEYIELIKSKYSKKPAR